MKKSEIVPMVFQVAKNYSLREMVQSRTGFEKNSIREELSYREHKTRLIHSTSTATIELSYYIAYCRDIFIKHQWGRQRIGYSTKGGVQRSSPVPSITIANIDCSWISCRVRLHCMTCKIHCGLVHISQYGCLPHRICRYRCPDILHNGPYILLFLAKMSPLLI